MPSTSRQGWWSSTTITLRSSPTPKPNLVVWYQVTGPLEQKRAELVDAITEAGWDVNEASASLGVWSAATEDHIMFVVVNQEMIARNPYAPEGTNAEISVKRLDDLPE